MAVYTMTPCIFLFADELQSYGGLSFRDRSKKTTALAMEKE